MAVSPVPIDLKAEIAAFTKKRLSNLGLKHIPVSVEVSFRKKNGKKNVAVNVIISPEYEIPNEFWEKCKKFIPGRLQAARAVVEHLMLNHNIPMTLAELSKVSRESVHQTFGKAKIHELNFHLRECQAAEDGKFLLLRAQKKLEPGEQPRYHIRQTFSSSSAR